MATDSHQVASLSEAGGGVVNPLPLAGLFPETAAAVLIFFSRGNQIGVTAVGAANPDTSERERNCAQQAARAVTGRLVFKEFPGGSLRNVFYQMTSIS